MVAASSGSGEGCGGRGTKRRAGLLTNGPSGLSLPCAVRSGGRQKVRTLTPVPPAGEKRTVARRTAQSYGWHGAQRTGRRLCGRAASATKHSAVLAPDRLVRHDSATQVECGLSHMRIILVVNEGVGPCQKI